MKDEVFDALTRWGKLGHWSSLHYGLAYREEKPEFGWTCLISEWQVGSVVFSTYAPPAIGFHPTSAHEAARIALREAAQRWPDMAEKAQP